jgi:DNA-binding protein YbaB
VTEATDDSPVTATAADGLVRVAFHASGLVESVTLAPKVKRLAVDDLADAIVEAVSAAQVELLRRAAELDRAANREANREAARRLSDELEQINAEYLRKTALYDSLGTEILKRMDG